jgi:hypothetical protein
LQKVNQIINQKKVLQMKKAIDLKLNEEFFFITANGIPEYEKVPGVKDIKYFAIEGMRITSLNLSENGKEIEINRRYTMPSVEVPGNKSTDAIFADEEEARLVANVANGKVLEELKRIQDTSTKFITLVKEVLAITASK